MKTFLLTLMFIGPISPQTIIKNPSFLHAETRIKIAVIDTGLTVTPETIPYLCNGDHYDFSGTGIEDTNGHGTNIAGVIAKQMNTQTHCLLIIKYATGQASINIKKASIWDSILKSFRKAREEGVKFVNFSSSGKDSNSDEKLEIGAIIKENIYFIVAAGNDGINLSQNCRAFPACYSFKSKYFKVVGNGTNELNRHVKSNYGGPVNSWKSGLRQDGFGVIMTGTSQSAAMKTGELLKGNGK